MERFFPFVVASATSNGKIFFPFVKEKEYKVIVYAITPKKHETAWLRYQLELVGSGVSVISRKLGVSHQAVSNVINGRCHSARIEEEIAKTIGYPSWNEMFRTLRSSS